MIMQQIWKYNTGWDKPIVATTMKQWQNFMTDYPNIAKITIPRFLQYTPLYSVELHGFCDASEKAYAATLYLRVETPSGHVYVN